MKKDILIKGHFVCKTDNPNILLMKFENDPANNELGRFYLYNQNDDTVSKTYDDPFSLIRDYVLKKIIWDTD